MIEKLKKEEDGRFIDEDGCSWETKADYLYIGVLHFCGCGDPASVGAYVKDMLLKHVKQTNSDDSACWDNTHYEDLPTMFFLYWADNEDFIEHGSTIRCSWMTKKGDELLRDLMEVEKEGQNE